MGGRDRTLEFLLAGYAAFETARGVAPELLAVVASVLVNVGIDEPFLAAALNAGFLATAIYVFTPVVFPGRLGDRRERPGFRLVVVGVSLLFAVPTSLALTTFEYLSVPAWFIYAYLTGAVLGGGTIFALYFRATQLEPLWAPDGDSLLLLLYKAEESAADHRQDLSRLDTEHPRVAAFLRGLSVVAAMSSFLIPCVLFGIAAATLDSFFPLLEVLVVAGLVLRAGGRLGVVDRPLPDVETRFYDRLTTAVRSTRGTVGVLMAVVSLLLAAFLVGLWAAVEGYWPGPIRNSIRALDRNVEWFLAGQMSPWLVVEQAIRVVESVGSVVALPLSSGYAMWYWYVELRRLTAIERGGEQSAARPPGFALPAAVLVVGWHLSLNSYQYDLPIDLVFGIVWPLATLAALWTVYRTRATSEASGELWAVPVGFVVYTGSVSIVLVAFVDFSRQFLVLVGILPWLFYLEDVEQRAEDILGRALATGYVLLPLVVAAGLRTVLNIDAVILGVLGGIVALFALGQVITHVYDEES